MNQKQILVTGPDGVLGSNLVRELLSRDYSVSVFLEKGKEPITLKDLPIERFYGNILNVEEVASAIAGKQIVFHCAASTSMFPARNPIVNKVNIDGTQNVVDACLHNKVERLIYVSTANSFGSGASPDHPGNEENDYTAGVYGIDYMDSKRKAQELILKNVKENGLPAIVINPTFMIGPYDSRPSSGAMILAIHEGKAPGSSSGGKNYIAVKDVAHVMANAITMGRIGECYIAGNYNLGYKEVFDMIAKTIGKKAPRYQLPNFVIIAFGTLNTFFASLFKYQPAFTKELAIISTHHHYYSSEKARTELQLRQTPLETAIKECYEWFDTNGYLKK
ncbi:MAG: NAD-dependent epimerase/dehydratase family protein [Bacteroidota bacterium]